MSEAVRQICEIAFEELDIVRITGQVYEPNAASRRVLEKNGFELEGILKKQFLKRVKFGISVFMGKQNRGMSDRNDNQRSKKE